MLRGDGCPFFVSPAASLLSSCVAAGALSQEEIDSAFSAQRPVFSSHVKEAEQQITMHRQLDEARLQLDLLKSDIDSSDVAHSYNLNKRISTFQSFCQHLQKVLREQKSLRQRLMRPLTRTNLPIPAHLQRYVVESLDLMLDFIQTMDEKISSAHSQTFTRDQLTLLISSVDQLLTQAVETENLTNQLLQRTSA